MFVTCFSRAIYVALLCLCFSATSSFAAPVCKGDTITYTQFDNVRRALVLNSPSRIVHTLEKSVTYEEAKLLLEQAQDHLPKSDVVCKVILSRREFGGLVQEISAFGRYKEAPTLFVLMVGIPHFDRRKFGLAVHRIVIGSDLIEIMQELR